MKAFIKLPLLAWTLAILMLALGVGAGIFLDSNFLTNQRATKEQRDFTNTYKYIDPLLACGEDDNIDEGQAKQLLNQLQASIDDHKNHGDITEASVYFRDIHGGPWVGIDYDRPFSPGSLLKLPLAISIYKQAEKDPTVLTKELDYTGKETTDSQYFPPMNLPAGKYPVAKLVEIMLQQSNNNAANVLAQNAGADSFEATYQHLGITVPPTQGADYTTTTRAYASFFRVLYNGTYLTPDDSEHLLELLTQATFRNGLVAGVPPEIPVAHKFGERAFGDSTTLQLHDCGIVYAPNHPYLLCIMTQGTDFMSMASTIADLSSITYNYVE